MRLLGGIDGGKNGNSRFGALMMLAMVAAPQANASFFFFRRSTTTTTTTEGGVAPANQSATSSAPQQVSQTEQPTQVIVPVITTTNANGSTSTASTTGWFSWWRRSAAVPAPAPTVSTSTDNLQPVINTEIIPMEQPASEPEVTPIQAKRIPNKHQRRRQAAKLCDSITHPLRPEEADQVVPPMELLKSVNFNTEKQQPMPIKSIRSRQSLGEVNRIHGIIDDFVTRTANAKELRFKRLTQSLVNFVIELAQIYRLEYYQTGNHSVILQKPSSTTTTSFVVAPIDQDQLQKTLRKASEDLISELPKPRVTVEFSESEEDLEQQQLSPEELKAAQEFKRIAHEEKRAHMRLFGMKKPSKLRPQHSERQFRAVREAGWPIVRSKFGCRGRWSERKVSRANQRIRNVNAAIHDHEDGNSKDDQGSADEVNEGDLSDMTWEEEQHLAYRYLEDEEDNSQDSYEQWEYDSDEEEDQVMMEEQ